MGHLAMAFARLWSCFERRTYSGGQTMRREPVRNTLRRGWLLVLDALVLFTDCLAFAAPPKISSDLAAADFDHQVDVIVQYRHTPTPRAVDLVGHGHARRREHPLGHERHHGFKHSMGYERSLGHGLYRSEFCRSGRCFLISLGRGQEGVTNGCRTIEADALG
jgi:hypothetical protein